MPNSAVGSKANDQASPNAALALKAAYDLEGQEREVIFVAANDLSDDEYDLLLDDLQAQTDAQVLAGELAFRGDPDLPALTPIDPETGDVGVTLVLQAMTPVSQSRFQVDVSYARSGLDGGTLTFTLIQEGSAWVIVEVNQNGLG